MRKGPIEPTSLRVREAKRATEANRREVANEDEFKSRINESRVNELTNSLKPSF